MKTLLLIVSLFISVQTFGQKADDFLIAREDTTYKKQFGYVFVNQKGDTVTRLDTSRYYICFSDTIRYFAVVGIKNKQGWWAIDRDEKLLFRVYNTSNGEPSPDEVRFGRIRIVDDSGKIGFANERGEVVIAPRFEMATSFYKDYAIIGRQCKQVLWCCEGKNEDKHYFTECRQNGYINRSGKILRMEKITFEQMQKKTGWKEEEF